MFHISSILWRSTNSFQIWLQLQDILLLLLSILFHKICWKNHKGKWYSNAMVNAMVNDCKNRAFIYNLYILLAQNMNLFWKGNLKVIITDRSNNSCGKNVPHKIFTNLYARRTVKKKIKKVSILSLTNLEKFSELWTTSWRRSRLVYLWNVVWKIFCFVF